VKIKGYRGPTNVPPIRVSNGIAAYRRSDGTWIYRRKPRRTYPNAETDKFNRDQMRLSAYLAQTTAPEFVDAARVFSKNSNDTWKDILTRAQFGTLFHIILADGTDYHPADHSYVPPEPEPTDQMAFQSLAGWDVDTQGSFTNLDVVIDPTVSEILIIAKGITGSVNSWLECLLSTNGGVSFHNTNGNYLLMPATSIATNTTAMFIGTQFSTAAQTCSLWLPTFSVGAKCVIGLNTAQAAFSTLFVANTLRPNAIRIRRTTGTCGGATGYVAVLGR